MITQDVAYCVVHVEGFKILDYNSFKLSRDDSVVHFIGTYKECIGFIARSNAIDSANREHVPNSLSYTARVPNWKYDTTKTVQENHKDFSEFCNSNNICLEDLVYYIYEEKGVATQDVMTANEIEQSLYSQCLEECEFKPKQAQRETYTKEEVYRVAQRSVHAIINNILTRNKMTIKQVINSEIDTVKIF